MAATPEDVIIASLGELKTTLATLTATVDALKSTVAAQERRLHLVYTAVVLVVGVIGGPNAIQALGT
jgi:hypothetical protein